MQNQSSTTPTIFYRPYNLPPNLPVISFVGKNWVPLSVLDNLHFHNCLEIGICHNGTGKIYVENQTFAYREGDICVIPAYTPHMVIRDTENSQWEYFAFDPIPFFPKRLWKQLQNADILTDYNPAFRNLLDSETNKRVTPLINEILTEFYAQRSSYRYSLTGLFVSLCTIITDYKPTLEPNSKISALRIKPALQLIHEKYAQKLTCLELANSCDLSETHFRRIFKSITTLSPLEYLNHFRIRKSCALLLSNKYSILETAQMSGFPTLSSYNRNFQAITNCSPSQWIKQQPGISSTHRIVSLDDKNLTSFFQF